MSVLNTNTDQEVNLYFYTPSTTLAIAFSASYLLLTLWHFSINFISTRHVSQKHKYTIPLFIASLVATGGWAVRIISIQNPDSITLYAISASFIVVSPIFVCATLYLLLTRLIRTTLPEGNRQQRFLGISPRWLGRVFVACDIFSFLTQCSDSGIASSGNWQGNLEIVGTNVLLFGLCLQLATFSGFLVILWSFVRRVGQCKETGLNPCVKRVIRGVWVAGFLVQVSHLLTLFSWSYASRRLD